MFEPNCLLYEFRKTFPHGVVPVTVEKDFQFITRSLKKCPIGKRYERLKQLDFQITIVLKRRAPICSTACSFSPCLCVCVQQKRKLAKIKRGKFVCLAGWGQKKNSFPRREIIFGLKRELVKSMYCAQFYFINKTFTLPWGWVHQSHTPCLFQVALGPGTPTAHSLLFCHLCVCACMLTLFAKLSHLP